MNRFFFLPDADKAQMLSDIGVSSVDELYNTVPKSAFITDLRLGSPMSENELKVFMRSKAQKNINATQSDLFIGAGCYYHDIPSAVGNIITRAEYITSYTPYQPEVSQGSLAAMFEFQTVITRLTGMDISNGSMYDGATALSEAVFMSHRINAKRGVYFVNNIHPRYRATVETNISTNGMIIVDEMSEDVACVVAQYPDFLGEVRAIDRSLADKYGAMLVVAVTEIVALGLLPPPTEADIVVGDAQSVGVPMSFGGPHLGFFACKEKYMRQLPGRVCGETVDADGNRAFALTISTREQHIRRGKATSNICTNQFLLALAFTVHMSLLGETGFGKLAMINHERCVYLHQLLSRINDIKILTECFFNEIAVAVPFDAKQFVRDMVRENVIAGYAVDERTLLIAVTEMNSHSAIERYVDLIKVYTAKFIGAKV